MTTTHTPSTGSASSRRRAGSVLLGAVAVTLPVAAVAVHVTDRDPTAPTAEARGHVEAAASGAGAAWTGPADDESYVVRTSGGAERALACDDTCVVLLADTDGDGYSDGYELFAGTDPQDASSRPAEALTHQLVEKGKLTRLRLTVHGPELVTATPGGLYHVDLATTPTGAPVVTNQLVGPDGKALTKNHYGIDVGSSGVDLRGLAETSRKDPASIGSIPGQSAPKPASEKPEIKDKHSPYADDDGGDSEDPPAPEPEDDPAPDPSGGDDDGGGDGSVAKEPKKMCNVGDPCGKDDIPPPSEKKDPQPKESGTGVWHALKCFFNPGGCTSTMTDPDAGGSTPIDTSQPPTKPGIAPVDPVRDPEPPIQAPTSPPTNPNGDPTIIHTNPDADPAPMPSAGTPPKPSIAPVDPPKPGDGTGPGPVPGGYEGGHTVRTR